MLATTAVSIVSSFSGNLSNDSPVFTRLGETTNDYYYDATNLIVDTDGTYQIESFSSELLIGYLYNNSFDSSDPSLNLIDSSSNENQTDNFQLFSTLNNDQSYILVVTSISPNETGTYSITLTGPGNAAFDDANPISKSQLIFNQNLVHVISLSNNRID